MSTREKKATFGSAGHFSVASANIRACLFGESKLYCYNCPQRYTCTDVDVSVETIILKYSDTWKIK